MSWLASLGLGLITALVGAFGTGAIALLCIDWYRISGREGGSGYFVIFLGILGGFVGLILGIVVSRILAGTQLSTFGDGFVAATSTVLGLLLIGVFVCWLAADLDTTLHGQDVVLLAEVRCPPGFSPPADATEETWYAHVDTRKRRVTSRAPLRVKEVRQEAGRWIIPTTLSLRTSVREKLLYVRLAELTELFVPVFPAKPSARFFEWSPWLEGGWDPSNPRPEPEHRFNFRFRLAMAPKAVELKASSEPTETEVQAAKEAQENAAFASLSLESPLEDYLKFTHYTQPEARRRKAGALLGGRKDLVGDLSREILSADRDTADRALRSLAFIKPLSAELAGPVAEVGDRLIAGLEKFNASKPVDDPGYQYAAELSVMFAGWFQAHQALHDFAGVDGRVQLEKIRELSSQREDSYVMKNDIARVTRACVDEWNQATLVK